MKCEAIFNPSTTFLYPFVMRRKRIKFQAQENDLQTDESRGWKHDSRSPNFAEAICMLSIVVDTCMRSRNVTGRRKQHHRLTLSQRIWGGITAQSIERVEALSKRNESIERMKPCPSERHMLTCMVAVQPHSSYALSMQRYSLPAVLSSHTALQ